MSHRNHRNHRNPRKDAEGVSPTEREYDRAAELHKPRLIFIKSLDENLRHPKEESLIKKVERDIVRKTFVDIEGLRTSVYASLVRYLEEKEYIRWQPFDAAFDTNATLDDLDEDKMSDFIRLAKAKRDFPLPLDSTPTQLLTHLSLMDDKGRISNSAVLLFGKRPQRFFITSEVKCVQFYGNVVEKSLPSYLSEKYPDVDFVYPMHLNPNVRKPIAQVFGEEVLKKKETVNHEPLTVNQYPNFFFIEPLQYLEFVYLMEKSTVVLTDSGGIQEETPAWANPCS